jgi:hypothetical protein
MPEVARVGILAFGSLIGHPGKEIEEVIVERRTDVLTPFRIEFARASQSRAGAPTLVPVQTGGSHIRAHLLVVNVTEREAKDKLWRRETNRVGQGGHYVERPNPGPNTLTIDRYVNLAGVSIVLAARFPPTIAPLTSAILANLAIESARKLDDGRDGISYLIEAKRNGIMTPLSLPYEQEILRRTGGSDLADSLRRVRSGKSDSPSATG